MRLVATLASAALWIGACVFDDTLPEDGSIALSCVSDEDCPTAWLCAASLERCVPRALVDEDDPSLESAALEPAATQPGGAFTLSFTVHERLGRAPVVALDGAALDLVVNEGTDGRSYTFAGRAPQVEADVDVPLTVRLVDVGGNSADLAPRALRVDATPPALLAGSVELAVTPPTGALRADVQAATVGSRARVAFLATEPLSSAPVPVAGPWRVVDVAGSGGLAWSLELEIVETSADPTADGAVPIDVALEDLVGNRAVVRVVDALALDRSPPPPPDVNAPGAVVHVRVPWGASSTGGAPLHQVRVAGLDAGDLVVVTNPANDIEIGRGLADEDGAAQVALAVDLARVQLRRVDAAGNASDAALAREVEWTASLIGKVPGSSLENPHAVYALEDAPVARASVAEVEAPLGALVAQPAVAWRADSDLRPPSAVGPAIAYDADLGRVIVYGGLTPVQVTAATGWAWDGLEWRALAEGPGPRSFGTLVYDAARRRAVLLGGINATTDELVADVWELVGESWVRTGEYAPTAQIAPPAAFDPMSGRVTLIAAGRTHTYDGASWQDDGAAPLVAVDTIAALTFDAALGGLVLVGAQDGFTWVRIAGQWIAHEVETPQPLGPCASLTNPDNGRTLIDDGATLWELTEDTWLPFAPSARINQDPACYASRDARGRPFSFARRARSFANGSWRDVDVDRLPAESRFGFIYSRALDARVAGTSEGIYQWSDTGRAQLLSAKSDPAAYLVAETGTGALLYDDISGTTLVLDADGLVTRQGVTLPNTTWQAAFAWDEARDEVVAYGMGAARDELWAFDGDAWVPRSAGGLSPGARPDAGMAFDRARGVVVLFGGGTPETWEWDGLAWRLADDAGPADQVVGPRLAYDDTADAILLFGGAAPGWIAQPRLWRWDGVSWQLLETREAPLGRALHGLLVDERDQALIAQSGMWELFLGTEVSDTSVLSLAPRAQSMRVDVRVDAARSEGGGVTGAALRLLASADLPGPLQVAGFSAGRALGWRALGVAASGAATTFELSAEQTGELMGASRGIASVLVSAPPAALGAPSAMSLEEVELTLRYVFAASP